MASYAKHQVKLTIGDKTIEDSAEGVARFVLENHRDDEFTVKTAIGFDHDGRKYTGRGLHFWFQKRINPTYDINEVTLVK